MEFDMIRRMGVPVHEVPDLKVWASYVEDLECVFVRAGLDPATRAWCADYLLSEVRPPSQSIASV